jgi:hypothetical protein
MTETKCPVAIRLTGCNPSDAAWDCLTIDSAGSPVDREHSGTIGPETLGAIQAARAALAANPLWESISVASDIECATLDAALDNAAEWQSNGETFICYAHGIYLQLRHKHVREAEIEFDVTHPDGTPLIASNR